MDWARVARDRHAAANQALARSLPSYSIPVGDSIYTAPGWIFRGVYYSTIPDSLYPWDPAVLRYIREFDPDAIPICIRYVYQWSHYNELGHLGPPVIIMRHGIARSIRDPEFPVWNYDWCELPVTGPRPARPNQVRDTWHDRDHREFGPDLPGAYLAFDWNYGHSLLEADEAAVRMLRESRRSESREGPAAVGSGHAFVSGKHDEIVRKDNAAKSENDYIHKDLTSYYCEEPSDIEWRNAIMRAPEPEKRDPVIAVPGVTAPAAPAQKEGAAQ